MPLEPVHVDSCISIWHYNLHVTVCNIMQHYNLYILQFFYIKWVFTTCIHQSLQQRTALYLVHLTVCNDKQYYNLYIL